MRTATQTGSHGLWISLEVRVGAVAGTRFAPGALTVVLGPAFAEQPLTYARGLARYVRNTTDQPRHKRLDRDHRVAAGTNRVVDDPFPIFCHPGSQPERSCVGLTGRFGPCSSEDVRTRSRTRVWRGSVKAFVDYAGRFASRTYPPALRPCVDGSSANAGPSPLLSEPVRGASSRSPPPFARARLRIPEHPLAFAT